MKASALVSYLVIFFLIQVGIICTILVMLRRKWKRRRRQAELMELGNMTGLGQSNGVCFSSFPSCLCRKAVALLLLLKKCCGIWNSFRFDERWQRPKTKKQIMTRYGFDIREGETQEEAEENQRKRQAEKVQDFSSFSSGLSSKAKSWATLLYL